MAPPQFDPKTMVDFDSHGLGDFFLIGMPFDRHYDIPPTGMSTPLKAYVEALFKGTSS
ncbi:hypothetical protein K435DRAFT_871373 [Dendrothele bispora CBS 962.96]|uniref:Uncharacterized protein n=1 Tax=Dendrothele bispora (strain CBS 962.96) TaxID=1314807 RepID=A0A4S8L473_DENBC|nr:hypothetical protein K435DRAFT_871373 [Dendrothele bispora CBS 962.96]